MVKGDCTGFPLAHGFNFALQHIGIYCIYMYILATHAILWVTRSDGSSQLFIFNLIVTNLIKSLFILVGQDGSNKSTGLWTN